MTASISDPRDAFFDVTGLKAAATRAVGRSTALVLTLSAIKLVLHLVSTVVLVRLIPPAEYGVASLAMPVAVILMNLSQFGLVQPIVQLHEVSHRLVSTLFWVNLALGILFGGGMALGAPAAAAFYNEPRVAPIFVVLGITVVFTSLLTQYIAILRRRLQVRVIEYGALAAFLGAVVLAVAAAVLGASYWAVIVQQVAQTVLTVAIYAACVPWRPSAPWHADLRGAREALNFGGNVAGHNLIQQISLALPTVLIGRVYGPFETSLYQRGTTLAALLPARTTTPLATVYIPTLSRMQEDPESFRRTFVEGLVRMNIILMPVAVMTFVTADIFVPTILGRDWAALAPVLAWLGLIMLQVTLNQGLSWSMISCGASRHLLYSGFLGLALVSITLALALPYGIIAVAASVIIVNQILRLPITAALALRTTHLTPKTLWQGYGIDLTVAVAAIGIAVLLRKSLDTASWSEFAFTAMLVLAIYTVRVVLTPDLRRVALKPLTALSRRRDV